MNKLVLSLLVVALVSGSKGFVVPEELKEVEWLSPMPRLTPYDQMAIMAQRWAEILGHKEEQTPRMKGYRKGTKKQYEDCGLAVLGSERVFGGGEVEPHSQPWMATLFMKKGEDRYLCGGTLINEDTVLTAGHCVDGFEAITVYLGAHNIREESEPNRLEFEAKEYAAHPEYNPATISNDVGYVRLPQAVEFTEYVRPVCVVTREDEDKPYRDLDTVVAGWGKVGSEDPSPVLRKADTLTITNLECILSGLLVVKPTNICIKGDGASTCQGDSGGPLMVVDEEGRHKEIGTTSFGIALGCHLGFPAAFARLTKYIDYLETISGLDLTA